MIQRYGKGFGKCKGWVEKIVGGRVPAALAAGYASGEGFHFRVGIPAAKAASTGMLLQACRGWGGRRMFSGFCGFYDIDQHE